MDMTGDKEAIKMYMLLSPFENQWIASNLKKTKIYAHAQSLLDVEAQLSNMHDIPPDEILLSFVTPSYEPSYFYKNSNYVPIKKNILPR